MDFNTFILCTDKNGLESQFKYSLEEIEEEGYVKWVFCVMPIEIIASDWYEFTITIISAGIGKVTLMNNRNMIEYRGKGISEKLIEESSKVLGLTIISSTNKQNKKILQSEFRTPPATFIWERLRNRGLANYDEESDIYTFCK